MLPWNGGEQRLGDHAFCGKLRPRDRRPQQSRVDLPGRQRLQLVARDHFLQRQIDLGQARPARRDQFGQKAVSRGGRKADLERSGLAHRDPARDLGGAFGEFEDPPRLGQEAAPGRRQPHRAAGALQQRRVDDVFENLDLPAERRLRHVEPHRRPAEMQLFGYRDKTPELVQIEHRCVPGMNEAPVWRF